MGEFSVNIAVTPCAADIVNTQAPDPLHAPPQPAKLEPLAGVAVRVTLEACPKLATQIAPQAMPPGLLEMLPVPVPDLLTVSAKFVGAGGVVAKLAVTFWDALIVTVQVEADPLHAPPQPVKLEPLKGAAVSVTLEPDAKLAVQVAPQAKPAGVLETPPVPVPALLTVTAKVCGATKL